MSKVYDVLKEHFEFPFDPHDFQEEALEEMSHMDASLLKFKVGWGKTATATYTALYYSIAADVNQIVVICPPILLDQWRIYLQKIKGIPEVVVYRGSPGERKKLDIERSSIVLVSYNIFRGKLDFARFQKMAKGNKQCIIADELSLKNLSSQTYRRIKDILYGKQRLVRGDGPRHKIIALNATPISDLEHVYNWCSLFSPGMYVSKRQFLNIHALKQDHWGKVLVWTGEELMKENLERFSIDTSKGTELPPLIRVPFYYALEKKHQDLYEEVKATCLDNLPEDKVELAVNSMFATLQRLVLQPSEYGLDIKSPILDYIDGYLGQMDSSEGVLIYSRHVSVSEMLAKEIPDSVAIYGGVSKKAREEAFEKLESGECKRLIGNLDSLGVGLNLQMLNHVIFAELPFRDDKLVQAMGRTHRQGQSLTCFACFPIALETLQERIFGRLLQNKEDLGKVLKDKESVRRFLS